MSISLAFAQDMATACESTARPGSRTDRAVMLRQAARMIRELARDREMALTQLAEAEATDDRRRS